MRGVISVGMRNAWSASSIKGRSWEVLLSRGSLLGRDHGNMEEGRPAFSIAYEDSTVQRYSDYTTMYAINPNSAASGDCQLV